MLKLAVHFQTFAGRLVRRHEGQTMAEYAVILTVISAVVLLALTALSGHVTTVINRVADAVK
jgi:Flp pilus assembly pilin Flp